MADRQQFQTELQVNPELEELMESCRGRRVTEKELREQRISFAYGNGMNSEGITRDSVIASSRRLRIAQD